MLIWVLNLWKETMEKIDAPAVFHKVMAASAMTAVVVLIAGFTYIEVQRKQTTEIVRHEIAAMKQSLSQELRAEQLVQMRSLNGDFVTRSEFNTIMDFLKEMRTDLNGRINRIENRIR